MLETGVARIAGLRRWIGGDLQRAQPAELGNRGQILLLRVALERDQLVAIREGCRRHHDRRAVTLFVLDGDLLRLRLRAEGRRVARIDGRHLTKVLGVGADLPGLKEHVELLTVAQAGFEVDDKAFGPKRLRIELAEQDLLAAGFVGEDDGRFALAGQADGRTGSSPTSARREPRGAGGQQDPASRSCRWSLS